MKTLVLSCSTGQGHNAAAAAIAEELIARGISCKSDEVLSFASKDVADTVKNTYDSMVLNHPRTFKSLIRIGGLMSSPRHRSPVYLANSKYADNLGAYIEGEGIDTVICSHMFPAQALTALISHGLKVRSYAVATDYLCLPFWEECSMDCFIVPHKDVVPEFVRRGIPEQKVRPLGLPIRQMFRIGRTRDEAREQLGLDTKAVVYLVLTGSMGFGRLSGLPRMLLEGDENAQVVVVAGRNAGLFDALENEYGQNPRFRAVGYTDEIATYMDAASVVLTKPGGLTSTEVAAKRIPLVHMPAIPGFEMRNAVFFSQRGMSARAENCDEAAGLAVMLAHCREECNRMLAAQRANIDAFAVCRICDHIQRDAGEEPSASPASAMAAKYFEQAEAYRG